MKEKDTIPPRNNTGTNNKKKAPDLMAKEQNDYNLQDKKQQENIFRTADNLKGCLHIVVAIIIACICYSQCTKSQKNTMKPDTEIVKSKN